MRLRDVPYSYRLFGTTPSYRSPRVKRDFITHARILLGSAFAALTLVSAGFYHYSTAVAPFPMIMQRNYLLLHLPPVLHGVVRNWLAPVDVGPLGPPRYVEEILDKPWAGSWAVPVPTLSVGGQVGAIRTQAPADIGSTGREEQPTPPHPSDPAWAAIYIFSTSTSASRARRGLIRAHHPHLNLQPALRHLIEVKFILGGAKTSPDGVGDGKAAESEAEEDDIAREQEEHGDIIRLKGLVNGDNMNQGKSWEFLKWAGSEGREAQWVFKCDDDTYVILPNLLDYLLTLDPSQPTYIGTSSHHWAGYHWYHEGLFYGFSWGVARTVAQSNVPKVHYAWSWDEDAFMGEMMYLLPSKPLCSGLPPQSRPHRFSRSTSCLTHDIPWDTPPPGGWSSPPLSPDPRSGLVRADAFERLGAYWDLYDPGPSKSLAWHWLKQDEQYLEAHKRAEAWFLKKHGRYMWEPPAEWEDKVTLRS